MHKLRSPPVPSFKAPIYRAAAFVFSLSAALLLLWSAKQPSELPALHDASPGLASSLSPRHEASHPPPASPPPSRPVTAPSPPHTPPPAALHIVTYLDYVGPLACASLRSALSYGLPLVALGLRSSGESAQYAAVSDPKRRKIPAMRAFMADLADSDVVLFNDGTDMMYTPRSRDALEVFLRIEQPGVVLFGAERRDGAPAHPRGLRLAPGSLVQLRALSVRDRNCWPFMDGQIERKPGGRATCERLAQGNTRCGPGAGLRKPPLQAPDPT